MSWQRTAVFLAALAFVPSIANAQQGPRDRAARSLITDAVEEYQNLEIDRSLERLQNAVRTCANNGCSPAMTARVHMAIGIVQVGGQQNTSAGVESMVRALQLDANAQPDAMLALPTAMPALVGPEAAINAMHYNQIVSLPAAERDAFIREKRAEYAADIEVYSAAADTMAVEAVVQPEELRGELIRRFALYARKRAEVFEKRNPVHPV